MTMFTQIAALLGQFGLSSITMSSIGEELVVTVRPSGGEVANAIKQPLVLTAMAVELDEGFGAALDQWAGIRTNIKNQLDAQAAEMEEAKEGSSIQAESRRRRAEVRPHGGNDAGGIGFW